MFEVEVKFRVEDVDGFRQRVEALRGEWSEPIEQVDSYFAHPSRNFAETDEAFRLRRVGTTNRVTYKGPKLDADTKTRREIELPLPEGAAYQARFRELLLALGFRPVADVRKLRRLAWIEWVGARVECCWDEVDRVGTFAELELTADEQQLDEARRQVLSLASELGLEDAERRSYLELLLGE